MAGMRSLMAGARHCRVPMIAAFAPATVSNVACGFDVLGFALDEPGDVVEAAPADVPGSRSSTCSVTVAASPATPEKNTAGAAAGALLDRLQTTRGVALTIHKGLPLESGIGCSGASAVAAVVAVNELLGRPAGSDVLLACAMAGSRRAAAPRTRTTSARRYSAASCWPATLTRRMSSACRCRPGWRARCSTRTCRFRPAPRARCWATRCRSRRGAPVGQPRRARCRAVTRATWRCCHGRSSIRGGAEARRLVPGLAAIKPPRRSGRARSGCSLSGSGPSIFALAAARSAGAQVGRGDGGARSPGTAAAWPRTSTCRRSARAAPAWWRGSDVRSSTRGAAARGGGVPLAAALSEGLAPDGGLYVPTD